MSDSSSEDNSDRGDSLDGRLYRYLREIETYLRITRAPRILRRYFAMNAFDGAMTSLGIVIGAYITDISDPRAVMGVIVLSGVAMGISGFSGTYMTESAERSKALNELEDAMLVDLNDTVHGQASKFVSVFAAIVDGSAPFLASLPSVLPFALSLLGIMSVQMAFQASMGASLAILFLLGVFLGRVSRTNIVYSGIKMVLAGVVVALLALLLNGGR